MTTHNTPPSEDPFADWEPGRNWLKPGHPLLHPIEDEPPHWLDPDLNEQNGDETATERKPHETR